MADGVFDAVCPRPNRVTNTDAALVERRAARKAVAGYALDADDLRFLLDVLRLWPKDDEDALHTHPMVERRDRSFKADG